VRENDGQPARNADSLTVICNRLYKRCGSSDVSQTHGSPRPVTGIAFLFFLLLSQELRLISTSSGSYVSSPAVTCGDRG
jgi:hypothetical protein